MPGCECTTCPAIVRFLNLRCPSQAAIVMHAGLLLADTVQRLMAILRAFCSRERCHSPPAAVSAKHGSCILLYLHTTCIPVVHTFHNRGGVVLHIFLAMLYTRIPGTMRHVNRSASSSSTRPRAHQDITCAEAQPDAKRKQRNPASWPPPPSAPPRSAQ